MEGLLDLRLLREPCDLWLFPSLTTPKMFILFQFSKLCVNFIPIFVLPPRHLTPSQVGQLKNLYGTTSLLVATLCGRLSVVQSLLEAGADSSISDKVSRIYLCGSLFQRSFSNPFGSFWSVSPHPSSRPHDCVCSVGSMSSLCCSSVCTYRIPILLYTVFLYWCWFVGRFPHSCSCIHFIFL